MSHVAADTGSEALQGVMLDIALLTRAHTATHGPQPLLRLLLGQLWSPNISTCTQSAYQYQGRREKGTCVAAEVNDTK